MALVTLVEDDDVDPGQLLVTLETLQQHTGGHHFDDRLRSCAPLAAYRETDPPASRPSPRGIRAATAPAKGTASRFCCDLSGFLTRFLAQQPRHAAGGSPRRHPPRLGDDDTPYRSVVR
jgi:hypothetical protein